MTHDPTDAEINELLDRFPDGMSNEMIATMLGVSKQRVGQILTSAMCKIVAAMRQRGLVLHDLIGN